MYSTTTKKSNLFGMGLQPFVFGKLTYLARYILDVDIWLHFVSYVAYSSTCMPCQISVIYCSNFNHIFLHTMCHFWILIRTFIRNTIVEKNNNYMKLCFCSKKISFAIHIINVKSLKKDNKSVSYSLIMVNRQLLCSSFLCSQIRFYKSLQAAQITRHFLLKF